MFSIRILQRARLCYSKWSFMYHSGKAFLLKKMSLIQEYYILMVFLNTGIKFRESRRMLCLNGIMLFLWHQLLKMIHSKMELTFGIYLIRTQSRTIIEWICLIATHVFDSQEFRILLVLTSICFCAISTSWLVATLLLFNLDFLPVHPLHVGTFHRFILIVWTLPVTEYSFSSTTMLMLIQLGHLSWNPGF